MFAEARENGKSHLREPIHIPEISLRRQGPPMQRQIHDQIAAELRGGRVRAAVRLPSSRVLASLLGVSRNTVLAAYDELVASSLIEGTRGSGMRFKGPALLPAIDLPGVLRSARHPARLVFLIDPDGNRAAVNY